MKSWNDEHPKASLMARKRKAILTAAGEAFLRLGYEGASMEMIAAAANVSIMTLYRHAQSKEDLFAAVIQNACDYSHDPQDAKSVALMGKPLREMLVTVGELFQAKLAKPETVALLRAVMVETTRFPHLAEAAYRSFVEAWEENLDRFMAQRPEFDGIAAATRRALIADFIDNLIGTEVLRALLGLSASAERERRSLEAADRFLAHLARERPGLR